MRVIMERYGVTGAGALLSLIEGVPMDHWRQAERSRTVQTSKRLIILILGLLTAIDAMSIDIYVPAIPELQRYFETSPSAVQATLSIFFVGIALGQALWGPLSDRYGRSRPLLIGLAIYAAGSLFAILADNLAVLIVGRFFQAIGASAGLVIARAMVDDLFEAEEGAQTYSILMQILGLTALVSPMLGGAVLLVASWRLIFALLLAVGLGCALATWLLLPESLPAARRRHVALAQHVAHYRTLLHSRAFLMPAFASAFSLGAMFAFLAGGSFIFVQDFGWSPSAYAILYAGTSIGFVLLCAINNAVLRRASAASLCRIGLLIQLALAASLFALIVAGRAEAWSVASIMALIMADLGLILGNSVACAMRHTDGHAGVGSGLLGILQFLVSAAAAPLATAGTNLALSISATILACALIAWGAFRQGQEGSSD